MKWILGPGEYNNWAINPSDGQVYDLSAGTPAKVVGQPAVKVIDVKGCLHSQMLIDDKGNLSIWGKSAAGETGQPTTTTSMPQPVLKDAAGNPFGNVKACVPYCNAIGGNGYLILKWDGTVWIMGNTQTGMRGDGSQGNPNDAAPVEVAMPLGFAPIVEIAAGIMCAARDGNGNVCSWGGGMTSGNAQYYPTYTLGRGVDNPDYTKPGLVKLPWPAASLCCGGFFNYAVNASGSVAGWGYTPEYLIGVATKNCPFPAGNTPIILDSYLKLPQPVSRLWMSTMCTYALLSDGSLFSWGDNAVGACGNGVELDFANYKNSSGQSAPYAWDWGRMELPQAAVQIGVGLKFVNVSTGLGDVFYFIAEDVDGNLYAAGRNKGGVLGNGVIAGAYVNGKLVADSTGNVASSYPNSWDVPWLTRINPFAGLPPVPTPCPLDAKKNASIATALVPGASLTVLASPAAAGQVALGGSFGTKATTINYWLWNQISGPSSALFVLNTDGRTLAKNLVPGTYIFSLKAVDNNWNVYTASVSVVVTAVSTDPGTTTPPVTNPPAIPILTDVAITSKINLATGKATISTMNYFSDGTTQAV